MAIDALGEQRGKKKLTSSDSRQHRGGDVIECTCHYLIHSQHRETGLIKNKIPPIHEQNIGADPNHRIYDGGAVAVVKVANPLPSSLSP